MPRPMAEVKSEEIGGQKVTTVTVATGAGAEGSAPAVQVTRSTGEEEVLRLWKAEDLAGAEQALRKLIESAAGDVRYAASLHAWLAQVLHEKGDDAGAIKERNEAARLAPDLLIFKVLAVKSMVESGDLPGAEAALRKYLELDPTNQAAARWLSDLQARQKGGGGTPAVALKALEGVSATSGSDEDLKAKPWLPDYHPPHITVSGRPVTPKLKEPVQQQLEDLHKEKARMQDESKKNEETLQAIKAMQDGGEGNKEALEDRGARLRDAQAELKQKISKVEDEEKKLVNDPVSWEEASPPVNKGAPPPGPPSAP